MGAATPTGIRNNFEGSRDPAVHPNATSTCQWSRPDRRSIICIIKPRYINTRYIVVAGGVGRKSVEVICRDRRQKSLRTPGLDYRIVLKMALAVLAAIVIVLARLAAAMKARDIKIKRLLFIIITVRGEKGDEKESDREKERWSSSRSNNNIFSNCN